MIHIKAFEPEPHYSWLSHFLFQCRTWYCILPPYNPRIGTWKMSSTFKILRYFCLFPKRAWCSWCIQCYPLFSRSKIMYSFFLDNLRVKLCPWRRLEIQISNKFLHAVIFIFCFWSTYNLVPPNAKILHHANGAMSIVQNILLYNILFIYFIM